MNTTTDALAILDDLIGDDTELRSMIAEEASKLRVAQIIYNARVSVGLTQKKLADRIGTSQPVIARLENADYDGHSLSMLNRIADAVDMTVEISLKPKQGNGYRPASVGNALPPPIRFITPNGTVNKDLKAYGQTNGPWKPTWSM